MNTNKLPRHADLDSQILAIDNPLGLALRLGCAATALITVIAWLGLFGLMFSGLVGWRLWPYVVAPIAGWVVLLGLPALKKTRKGALTILDAVATTAEAWLARAGYSIDLNNDGYIGPFQPAIQPPIVEEHTPIPYIANGQAKLLAHQVQAGPGVDQLQPEQPAATAPPLKRHIWALPNGAKVEQAQVEYFSDRLSIVGLSRAEWVGKNKPLEREQFEGLVTLLEQAGVIEGRKKGHVGKLIVKRADHRRRVLGLPLGTVAKADDPGSLDAGNFQHI